MKYTFSGAMRCEVRCARTSGPHDRDSDVSQVHPFHHGAGEGRMEGKTWKKFLQVFCF